MIFKPGGEKGEGPTIRSPSRTQEGQKKKKADAPKFRQNRGKRRITVYHSRKKPLYKATKLFLVVKGRKMAGKQKRIEGKREASGRRNPSRVRNASIKRKKKKGGPCLRNERGRGETFQKPNDGALRSDKGGNGRGRRGNGEHTIILKTVGSA